LAKGYILGQNLVPAMATDHFWISNPFADCNSQNSWITECEEEDSSPEGMSVDDEQFETRESVLHRSAPPTRSPCLETRLANIFGRALNDRGQKGRNFMT
tara:strand:- start:377 stop:676 length:300 start_codon:yes stop_codon:yes gene_type:complete